MFLVFHEIFRLAVLINFVLIKTRTELPSCEAIDVKKLALVILLYLVTNLRLVQT